MTTLALNKLLEPLLSLSFSDQRWLAGRLYEAADAQEAKAAQHEAELEAIRDAFRQVKLIQEGKIKGKPWKELYNELRDNND